VSATVDFKTVQKKLRRYVGQRAASGWPKDPEDLAQEIWVSLWKAVESDGYDAERGYSYLFRVIDNTIRMYRSHRFARKRKPYITVGEGEDAVIASEVSLEALEDAGGGLGMGDDLKEPLGVDAANAKAILLSKLPPLQRKIVACWINPPPELLILSRNLGHKLKRIYVARYLGLSKHQVLDALKRARETLKELDVDFLEREC